jgi:hypothetical protein
MFGAELILDIRLRLIFLLFGDDPWGAFGFGFIKIRVVNVLAFVLAYFEPEVASLFSGYWFEEVVLIDLFGWFGGGWEIAIWLFVVGSTVMVEVLVA